MTMASDAMLPAQQTRLIVVRGNSGSGKSSVAKAIRDAYGRGVAIVGQDNIRRTILRDRDRPGTPNIGLIEQVARYSLDSGFHVVVEGILDARRYGSMLASLQAAHRGPSYFYYLDISLDETIRRHATRSQASEFGADDMRDWYLRLDLLPSVCERVIGEGSTLEQTVNVILTESGLLHAVVLRAEAAARSDIGSWLELAAEVEPLFGPMPDLETHIRRAIDRDTAVVVRDPREVVLGAALLSADPRDRKISWLAVRAQARRRGVGRLLMAEILRRSHVPGSLEVLTLGAGVPGGEPARSLYQSLGFVPLENPLAGPAGASRQRFVLQRN
jgi:GNAT superfamily N-acetyltransferase